MTLWFNSYSSSSASIPPKRPALTTSRVFGSPDPPPPFRSRRAFDKLTFRAPVYLASDPAHDSLFVVEQNGRIVRFRPGDAKAEMFLQLKDADAYAMTFHPRYRDNRFVYVFSNGPNSKPKRNNQILRFTTKGDPPTCDPGSRQLIIEWPSNGHNGGDLAFGPDGMLYLSSGDGTSDSDGDNTGQDLTDLCSGILRIDVDKPDKGKGYRVPADNPFLKVKGARPELWAFGLRNPWRMSFDRETKDLYIGDVGQDWVEMIHLGKSGANYGWSVMEGTKVFRPDAKRGPGPIVAPLVEHAHAESRSITAGVVYRGKKSPALQGVFVYGDYSTGKVWGLKQKAGKVTWRKELATTRLQIVGFGADRDGELYIVDHAGTIHTLEASPPAKGPSRFPRKLSDSGLFADVARYKPHAALIPYSVNSPLWSDGAHKERHVALPGDATMRVTAEGPWGLPERTVLVKTFALDTADGARRRVETRFLTRQDGEWYGYSYAWNDAQTDAELVEAGGKDKTYTIREGAEKKTLTWRYPSRAECMVCHTRAANYVLGLTTAQLNRDVEVAGKRVNQLSWFEGQGTLRVGRDQHWQALQRRGREAMSLAGAFGDALFRPIPEQFTSPAKKRVADKLELRAKTARVKGGETHLLPADPADLPRLADPADDKAPLEARVRSYLHANCANCHVWAGGGNAAIDLHVNTPLAKTHLVRGKPLHDRFGIAEAELVAPGSPERSILYQRLSRRGKGQMPPLASTRIDPLAKGLVGRWVRQLK